MRNNIHRALLANDHIANVDRTGLLPLDLVVQPPAPHVDHALDLASTSHGANQDRVEDVPWIPRPEAHGNGRVARFGFQQKR